MNSTSDEIRQVALRLMEKGGAPAVSMRRVAKSVGVTPMAIYHHFKSRSALLDAVVAREFSELEQRFVTAKFAGTIQQKLVLILELYSDYARDRPRVFDYVFAEEREGSRQYPRDFRAGASPTLNRLAEVLQEGMAKRVLKRGDKWEIAMGLWAHVHGFVMLRRAGRFALSEKEFHTLVRRSINTFIHGLESNSPSTR